jgi:uncharacterized protein (TIGR03435 family)
MTIDLPGVSMSEFARNLGGSARPVIDKTEIAQRFDFHLEFAPDGAGARLQYSRLIREAMRRCFIIRSLPRSSRANGHRPRNRARQQVDVSRWGVTRR